MSDKHRLAKEAAASISTGDLAADAGMLKFWKSTQGVPVTDEMERAFLVGCVMARANERLHRNAAIQDSMARN